MQELRAFLIWSELARALSVNIVIVIVNVVVSYVDRSNLLQIRLRTGPKGETGGVTSIWSVATFFDIFEDLIS